MRVLFAGDIHGNGRHMTEVVRLAEDADAKAIIACGDFGFWPHMEFGKSFLQHTSRILADAGIPLYWIDGNHENHDWLDMLVETYGNEAPIEHVPGIYYIPRGCVFTLGESTIMGYGGAWSIDWEDRTRGKSWWPQETIRVGHVWQMEPTKVNILVTHEAPIGIDLSYKDEIAISRQQREMVSEIVRLTRPDLVVHGHHHVRQTYKAVVPGEDFTCRVEGLDCDGAGLDSVLLVEV